MKFIRYEAKMGAEGNNSFDRTQRTGRRNAEIGVLSLDESWIYPLKELIPV